MPNQPKKEIPPVEAPPPEPVATEPPAEGDPQVDAYRLQRDLAVRQAHAYIDDARLSRDQS